LANQYGVLEKQMEIGPILFAMATIALGFWAESHLDGTTGKLFIMGLAMAVMFLGPQFFGRDWYYEGFVAGMFMGDFYGTITTRQEIEERAKPSN
jgi:hypothetical protein